MNEIVDVDPAVLAKWNRAVPRYTSYPTAPQFYPIEESVVREKLNQLDGPVSVYLHIPFCRSMCLFCGCSVVLNRKPERQTLYLESLFKEIEMVCAGKKRVATQVHLGGGTPTSLTEEELIQLMEHLRRHFIFSSDAEISIEVDPRTVFADQGKKLTLIKKLGFNRISFGVQDLDPVVQEAVRRRQSEEMSVMAYELARKLEFESITMELIYGLPHQTVERFSRTAEKFLALRPDRIVCYSYAKIPWLKEHQKAIPDETLPSDEEKFKIYTTSRARWMKGGYTAIGMDHFALESDTLALAYRQKKLTRNFQGYSVQRADDMIAFGLSSIGFMMNTFLQNRKDLEAYQQSIAEGKLPIERGFILSEEDLRRRWIIQSLMCHFELDKKLYEQTFQRPFDYPPLNLEGLVEESANKIIPTPLGRLLIRIVASAFDGYIQSGRFSKAV